MEPTSPPTDRVLRIVHLLASRPYEAFTLSDLVRELGINRATGHAIVSTLTASGHLVRHPQTRTYSLGPAWVAVGRAAEQARPEVAHAFAMIEELAAACGAPCGVSAVLGQEILHLGTSSRGLGESTLPKVGQRIPFVPPYGSSALVDAPEAELEAWLARAAPGVSAEERHRYRERVDFVREHGYGIERLTETQARLRQILVELQASPLDGPLEQQVGRLIQQLHQRDGDATHALDRPGPVSEIFAPVRGTGLTLSLHFEQRTLSRREVEDTAARLLEACQQIEKAAPERSVAS